MIVKARVKCKGIAYREGQNIDIRNLLKDALGLSDGETYKTTQKSVLKNKISRKGSLSDDQETIINQLDLPP